MPDFTAQITPSSTPSLTVTSTQVASVRIINAPPVPVITPRTTGQAYPL